MLQILKKLKQQIISIYLAFKLLPTKKRRIFIFDIPLFANLGDQAIIESEKNFLKINFHNIKIIEISSYILDKKKLREQVMKSITDRDIVFTTGGGSLDARAYHVVERFNYIIDKLKDHQIIMFPQTIDFHEKKDIDLLNSTKKIYSQNPNLILCAREIYSYQKMKKYYPTNKVLLTPDIVLYNNFSFNKKRTNKVLLILRNDMEKNINIKDNEKINEILNKYNINIENYDTLLTHNGEKRKIYRFNRKLFLYLNYNKFAKSRFIITDRLHGMIFAAITGTPAIVFPNSNHKVIGVYKWIQNLPFIELILSVNDFEESLKKIINISKKTYQPPNLKIKFNPLLYEIGKLVNGDLNE